MLYSGGMTTASSTQPPRHFLAAHPTAFLTLGATTPHITEEEVSLSVNVPRVVFDAIDGPHFETDAYGYKTVSAGNVSIVFRVSFADPCDMHIVERSWDA